MGKAALKKESSSSLGKRKRDSTAGSKKTKTESKSKSKSKSKNRAVEARPATTPRRKSTSRRKSQHATTPKPAARATRIETPRSKPSVVMMPYRWQDWEKVFLVGTEFENLDGVYSIPWDFNHLEDDLEDPQSMIRERGNKLHIFGCTEPQLLTVDGESKVVCVPVMVVIDSSMPPPEQVALASVQRSSETIVPMRDLRISWTPYGSDFILTCSKRRAETSKWVQQKLKEDEYARMLEEKKRNQEDLNGMEEKDPSKTTYALMNYCYAMPYIFIPKNQEPKPVDSEVNVVLTVAGVGANFVFDWKFDEAEEKAEEILTSLGIEVNEANTKSVIDGINEHVEEAKNAIRAERQKAKEQLDSISEEQKESLNSLRCFKYYPQNDLNIGRSRFVNRYYGSAMKYFPQEEEVN